MRNFTARALRQEMENGTVLNWLPRKACARQTFEVRNSCAHCRKNIGNTRFYCLARYLPTIVIVTYDASQRVTYLGVDWQQD